MRKFSGLLYSLLIIVLSFFTFLPLLHSGFFNFHDNTQVVRVFEMGNSLASGMFPVRWVTDLGYGYGYPIFNFYGPLPYYIGGILFNAGIDVLLATKIMFFVGIILSGISMFFLVRKIFGDVAGVVSGVLYTYFPYHAVNIYVRGAVGEFFAYAFLPILFLGIFGLFEEEQKKLFASKNILHMTTIALGLFLIALSHNLTLFMLFIILLPLLFIITILKKKSKGTFLMLVIAGLTLGILLSSFYIIPAFLEMKYTNVSSQVGGGADFRDHFVCISQYWNSMWGYGGSTKGCVDGLSFKLGKFDILLFASALLAFGFSIYKRKLRKVEKFTTLALILFVISLFFTLEISEMLWKAIPYMQYLQYPWRFINFIGFFMILGIGYLLFRIEELFSRRVLLLSALVIIFITIISSYKLFEPQEYVNLSPQFYTNSNYIKFTVSKISDEYMPSSFSVPRNLNEVPSSELSLINSSGNVQVLESKANYLKSSFDIFKDGVLHVNRAYFPAWRAYENGKEIPIVPTHNGMNVSLQQGNGIFELKFVQTATETVANTITIVALVLGIFVVTIPFLQAKKRKKTV